MNESKKSKGGTIEARCRLLILGVLVLSFLIAGIFYWQMKRLEQGALDVCAVQQDAYVQLVLDQINLKEHREDEEIIESILSTLDASTNKYWVFTKGQDMLFVKDVLETNKYKGLTSASYYDPDSAREFYETLQINHVRHGTIVLDGKSYVASGVAFEYNGNSFRLCLLTNRDIILENNAFLRAKSEMWVLVIGSLILLMIVTSVLVEWIHRLLREAEEAQETIHTLNRGLTEMNERLVHRDFYDNTRNTWEIQALPKFLQRIQEKHFSKLTLADVHCESRTAQEHFLALSHQFLTKEVLLFEGEEYDLTLLFVGIDGLTVLTSIQPLLHQGCTLGKIRIISTPEELDALLVGEETLETPAYSGS